MRTDPITNHAPGLLRRARGPAPQPAPSPALAPSPAPPPELAPPPARGQGRRRLARSVGACVGFVLLVVAVDSSGLISERASLVVDNLAQLSAGTLAAVVCWVNAARSRGPARTWRRLMGLGLTGWSIGMALWAYYQLFADTPLPSPSWADVGFLSMPVFALPALLSLAIEPPRRTETVVPLAPVVLLLDGLIVVGSLFTITWATSLGAVVHSTAPTVSAFTVAVAYPTTDLMLVVIMMLLVVTRRVPPQYRTQLWLLCSGLVAFSVSDSIFYYLVSTGADEMPPIFNAGFVLGPLLVAVAGATREDGPSGGGHAPAARAVERAHLLLPYVLVGITGLVVLVQNAAGAEIDTLEVAVAWLVLGLVLVRQSITLLENRALLEQVSAAQAELAYRAHHDPLTGLANRSLFGERLDGAVRRHRDHGRRFALLVVDLDDFKAVNDTHGHAAGDRLLQAVGERLRGCVREADTVARLGGDEFAVVLEGASETPDIVGERILGALRQPFPLDGRLLSVGASIGVVEPADDEAALTADVLLHRADGAMYVGKRRGKGVTVRFGPGVDAIGAIDAAVDAAGSGTAGRDGSDAAGSGRSGAAGSDGSGTAGSDGSGTAGRDGSGADGSDDPAAGYPPHPLRPRGSAVTSTTPGGPSPSVSTGRDG